MTNPCHCKRFARCGSRMLHNTRGSCAVCAAGKHVRHTHFLYAVGDHELAGMRPPKAGTRQRAKPRGIYGLGMATAERRRKSQRTARKIAAMSCWISAVVAQSDPYDHCTAEQAVSVADAAFPLARNVKPRKGGTGHENTDGRGGAAGGRVRKRGAQRAGG